ncbi:unnamed protein product [Cochlearia groenlandica]
MYTSSVVERPKFFGLVDSKLSSVADLPFDDEFHATQLASEEVGNGHMNDVIYAFVSESGDLRFKNLVERRDSSDGGARA